MVSAPESASPKVSARVVLASMAVALKRGISEAEIAEAAGTTSEALRDPEGYLPAPVWKAVLAEVERRTGDPWAGMHSAEIVQFGTYGVVDYVVASSPSVRDGFRSFARYFSVLNAATAMVIDETDEGLWVERQNADPTLPRHAAEFGLATTFLRFSRFTAEPWTPVRVELRSPIPADDSEYRRIFRSPVRFARGRDAFLVAKDVLDRPMANPDPALHALMEQHGRWLLGRLPKERPFLATVADKLRSQLSTGDVTITALAAALHLSERTLQRRLADEGTTFRELLDRVRADLARSYLSSPEMSIGEVAFMLGFSETSTFHRAFRQWTGQTPGMFRTAQAGARPA
ncbi:MAG: AraC family transcriptional regulator [Deltaproteobacteria bacterium]|nr:AraC family transcriptional regulator [Deltaproteobacteria bacterium]